MQRAAAAAAAQAQHVSSETWGRQADRPGASAAAAVVAAGPGLHIPQITFRPIQPEPAVSAPVAPVLHIPLPVPRPLAANATARRAGAAAAGGHHGGSGSDLFAGSGVSLNVPEAGGMPAASSLASQGYRHQPHGRQCEREGRLWRLKQEDSAAEVSEWCGGNGQVSDGSITPCR